MRDALGREIDYLRLSVTDRCDLRCVYCMPREGVPTIPRSELLSYEEILRIVGLLAEQGIKKVRLTGGEPLVRKGLPKLVEGLKRTNGIETVYLTTNGMLLSEMLPELVAAGLDGVNISIDALSEEVFQKITGSGGVCKVLRSIDEALKYSSLRVKLNCVATELNRSEILPMAERFLKDERISLRFIELMPIGLGKECEPVWESELMSMLEGRFGSLLPLPHNRCDGPCRSYRSEGFAGTLGFISAVSSCFCESCNRVRLTAGGFLKSCLQYDRGVELKPLLSESDAVLSQAICGAIWEKPARHMFYGGAGEHLEEHTMSQIGG